MIVAMLLDDVSILSFEHRIAQVLFLSIPTLVQSNVGYVTAKGAVLLSSIVEF